MLPRSECPSRRDVAAYVGYGFGRSARCSRYRRLKGRSQRPTQRRPDHVDVVLAPASPHRHDPIDHCGQHLPLRHDIPTTHGGYPPFRSGGGVTPGSTTRSRLSSSLPRSGPPGPCLGEVHDLAYRCPRSGRELQPGSLATQLYWPRGTATDAAPGHHPRAFLAVALRPGHAPAVHPGCGRGTSN
jgi:hypothetical protein